MVGQRHGLWSGRVVTLAALAAIASGAPATGPAAAQSLVPGGAWSGAYLGVHGGTAWADAASVRRSDLLLGGHIGYGLGLGALYLGIEADAAPSGTRRSYDLGPLYSSRVEVDWTASLRGRLGITLGSALLYGTAGAAWSGETIGTYRLATPLSAEAHRSTGLVYGAGLEINILPSLVGRIEALSYDVSDRGAAIARALPSGAPPSSVPGSLGETVVRAGITLRLR